MALASGLAGAYALVDEKISPALPGVAIATAIVPPLATVGLNLATGQWSMAEEPHPCSWLTSCIEFAAAVVFVVGTDVPQDETGIH